MSGILFLGVLVLLSAFFSGSETAFFSLGKVRLEKFKKKNRKALRIEALKDKPDYLLSSILLGNMFVNIALSSIVTVILINRFPEFGAILSVIVSSVIILIFGEILPKSIAIHTAERFALFSSYIMSVYSKLSRPICRLMLFISRQIFKRLFGNFQLKEDTLTEEELKEALKAGRAEGFIDLEEESMIHSVLDFADTKVSEIMTPRVDIKAVDIDSLPGDIEEEIKEIRHSYVLVFREKIDEIIGVLKTKEYFLSEDKNISLMLKQPLFIPETKRISSLLRDLTSKKEKISLVVDEYGGLSGLVTLEDIQEEIFGEIYDEYENPSEPVKRISEKEFLVSAKTAVKDLNSQMDLTLPEEEDSLGGFILSLIEHLPKEGEVVTYRDLEFVIVRATRRKIVKVLLKIKK